VPTLARDSARCSKLVLGSSAVLVACWWGCAPGKPSLDERGAQRSSPPGLRAPAPPAKPSGVAPRALGSPRSSGAATAATAPAPATPGASSARSAVALPDQVAVTPAGQQLAWLLPVLMAGGVVDERAVTEHFSAGFLRRRSMAKTIAAVATLAGHFKGFVLGDVTAPGADQVLARARVQEAAILISLRVDPTSRLIEELEISPDSATRPTSLNQAVTMVKGLAPRSQLLVAELVGGACQPIARWNAREPLAIASVFKLYVLLAVVDRILAGKAAWDDLVEVRAEWKSLPSGITQDEADGAKLSLRQLATRMISISDNTAADILLYTAGRREVERAMRTAHHARVALNLPFLSTRELFWMKTAMSAAEVEAYLRLTGVGARRRFLDGLTGRRPVTDFEDWKTPRYIDTLEWFASSEDLCALASALQARSQHRGGAPLLGVLGENPGLRGVQRWRYVGFKGGSEPGVVAGLWLLQRDDCRWFVVTLAANGPAAIDEGVVLGISEGVTGVLADLDRSHAGSGAAPSSCPQEASSDADQHQAADRDRGSPEAGADPPADRKPDR
jgi:Beta-lactamase enzyme family